MTYNPDIHHRRSIRLKGYDYSQTGAYFVSICTQDREFLFGEIKNGIVVLVGAGPRACPDNGQPRGNGQPQGVAPTLSLPDVVHRFKTMTTKRYVDGAKRYGWPPFPGKLWQRNYYEHIIRNENELNRTREYIISNPMKWESDRENPDFSILETTGAHREGQS